MRFLCCLATKETSYVYSIIAAGVTHHMIRSCYLGKEPKCQCNLETSPKSGMGTTLMPCKKNIQYGLKRAKKILKIMDLRNVKGNTRRFFNWRNAVSGWKVIKHI